MEQNLIYKPQPYMNESVYDPRVYRNNLGIGLGNLNSVPQQSFIQQEGNGPMIQQPKQKQIGMIEPLLGNGQAYGANVEVNVSPNLEYVRYGGQVAGRLGDLTGTFSGSKERAGEWEQNGRSVGLQYTPEQLKGLVLQAAIAKRDDNFGNTSRTTSGGISYLNGNLNAGITGSREQRNDGTVDNTIDAKIGYRF